MRLKMKNALLVLAVAVGVAACGSSKEPVRTTVPLASVETASPESMTREDAIRALEAEAQAPVFVTVESTSAEKSERNLLSDTQADVVGRTTRSGAMVALRVSDGEALAAFADEDGLTHWIRWDDVVTTWAKAVNESVKPELREELSAWYSSTTPQGMLDDLRSSALALLSQTLDAKLFIACAKEDAKSSQGSDGAWTFTCERLMTTVTVWLDQQGRAARVDVVDSLGTTRGIAKWGEKRPLSPAEVDKGYDLKNVQRVMERSAKAASDEISDFEQVGEQN